MRHRPTPSAFTIIELLVAMSVAVLLGFLINTLFFETTNAVSRGIATSRIINKTRTFGELIDNDAKDMVPPNAATAATADGGGVLVIINHQIGNVDFFDPRFGGVFTRPAPVRSDQLMFIYDMSSEPLEPIAPGSTSAFSNSTNAPYARVWYGHVERTTVGFDGSISTALGAPGANRLGHNWVLGRHVLFLDEDASAGSILTTSPIYNAAVAGYTPGTNINASIPLTMQWALTDMAHFSFNNPGSTVVTANSNARRLVGSSSEGTYFENYDAGTGMTDVTYHGKAIALMFAQERMRVNPVPENNTFLSSQIAQGHPYLMSEVSDFIVEFAGDFTDVAGTGAPDGAIDANVNGIIWYSHYSAVAPPSASFNAGSIGPTYHHSGNTGTYGALPTNAAAVFVFRHDDPADGTNHWPHLLRIRYHMHDPKGELTGINEDLLSNTIDDNLDGTTDDADEARDNGKWFEVILKVNRS